MKPPDGINHENTENILKTKPGFGIRTGSGGKNGVIPVEFKEPLTGILNSRVIPTLILS